MQKGRPVGYYAGLFKRNDRIKYAVALRRGNNINADADDQIVSGGLLQQNSRNLSAPDQHVVWPFQADISLRRELPYRLKQA